MLAINTGVRAAILGAHALAVTMAVLLRWASGTFANASPRNVWEMSTQEPLGSFVGGTAAVVDIDGDNYIQIEGAATNLLPAISVWSVNGTAVRTSGVDDPFGGTGAYNLAGLDGTGDDASKTTSGGSEGTLRQVSVPLRRVSTSGVLKISSPYGDSVGEWHLDLAAVDDGWQNITADHPAVTVVAPFVGYTGGPGGVRFHAESGGPIEVDVWEPQEVEALYPTSVVAASTTRAADSLSFAAEDVPNALLSGAWWLQVTPYHASVDLPAPAERAAVLHYLYYIDSSNYLALRETGPYVMEVRWATSGGTVSRSLAYARHDNLSIGLDFATGSLTVLGALSGNGTTTGTVSDWPSGTLHVGSDDVGSWMLDGRMGEPQAGSVPLDAIAAAGGASMTWRTEASESLAGTLPDAASAPNMANPGNGDVSQGVVLERPHIGGGTGVDAHLDFDISASQSLQNPSIAAPLLDDGDECALIVVAKFVVSGEKTLFETSGNTALHSRGLTLKLTGGNLRAQARVQSGALITADIAMPSDPQVHHLMAAHLTASGLTVWLDGASVTTATANTGIALDQDAVSVGQRFGSPAPMEGQLKTAIVLQAPAAQTFTDTKAAVAAKFGTP